MRVVETILNNPQKVLEVLKKEIDNEGGLLVEWRKNNTFPLLNSILLCEILIELRKLTSAKEDSCPTN